MHETNKIVGITQVPNKYFALGRQTACASENGVMPMNEQIDLLRREVESTLRMLHALKQFRIAMTILEDVKSANQNVNFWRLFEAALQSRLFIGLRRIFDDGRDTFSIHKFLINCREQIDIFSKRELKIRRSSSPNSHEWIDEFIKETYEPTVADFNEFGKFLDQKMCM